MNLNYVFWTEYFDRVFIAQTKAFLKAAQDRIVPTFDSIEKEADDIANAEYDRLGSLPWDGFSDMSDVAEKALEAGIEYYQIIEGIRQGVINMMSASLYHLFEQHIKSFHRKELLEIHEERNTKLYEMDIIKERLLNYDIDIYTFASWHKISELRLVANTIKHAEGSSSKKLKKLRQDIFVHPRFRSEPVGGLFNSPGPVYMPMAGRDFYITMNDFQDYADNLVNFWIELADAMANAQF